METKNLFKRRVPYIVPWSDAVATQVAPGGKIQMANMGPIWGRQDPDWPHVGPINLVIRGPSISSNVLDMVGQEQFATRMVT